MNHWQKAVYLFSTLLALAPLSVLGIMTQTHDVAFSPLFYTSQIISPSGALDLLKQNLTIPQIPQSIHIPVYAPPHSITTSLTPQTTWNFQIIQNWLKNEVGIDVVKFSQWLLAMGKIILGFFVQFLTMVLGVLHKVTKP